MENEKLSVFLSVRVKTRERASVHTCVSCPHFRMKTHTHTHTCTQARAHTHKVDAHNTVDSLIAENFLAEVDHNVTLTRLEQVELLHDVENYPIVGLVRLNEETALVVLEEIFDRELAIL